jgi:hypothetical protein
VSPKDSRITLGQDTYNLETQPIFKTLCACVLADAPPKDERLTLAAAVELQPAMGRKEFDGEEVM